MEYDIKKLTRDAEKGNDKAQYLLGECYLYGEGVPVDWDKAFMWIHKASDQGNEYAAEILDDVDEVRAYRKAAAEGNAEGQYKLGECYLDGKGVFENIDEAMRWFRKAAEQGHQEAKELLAEVEAAVDFWDSFGFDEEDEDEDEEDEDEEEEDWEEEEEEDKD